MLSKVFKSMFSTAPRVWVNKHTKVICQGITGNQVNLYSFRALSKLNKLSTMALKWSVVSTQKRLDLLISVSLFSRTAETQRRALELMPASSTCLLLSQLALFSRLFKPSWTSLLLLLMVFPSTTWSRSSTPFVNRKKLESLAPTAQESSSLMSARSVSCPDISTDLAKSES